MSSLSRVFGWAPPQGEEHVEIPSRPASPHPRILTFQTNAEGRLPSPTSSISSLPSEHESQPEAFATGSTHRIPRPRNPFIIFRVEYSRSHAKGGKRIRGRTAIKEKSLSKRAAEAWHQLSEEDKKDFFERSLQEKNEHARLYPDYRYKPAKRKTKKNAQRTSPLLKSPLTTNPAIPPASRTPTPSPTIEFPIPPPPPSSVDMSAIKATRRRSASVPSLPVGQYPSTLGFWAAPQPLGTELKRPRSVAGNRVIFPSQTAPPPTPFEGFAFDPRLFEANCAGFYTPDGSFSPTQEAIPDDFQFLNHFSSRSASQPSPLAAVASSLAGWNGEPSSVIGTPPASMSPWSSSSSALNFDGSVPQQYPRYAGPNNTPEAGLALELANYSSSNNWVGLQSYFPIMNEMAAAENTGSLFAATTCNDEVEQYALQDYRIGLDARMGGLSVVNEEEAMMALNINDYLQTY